MKRSLHIVLAFGFLYFTALSQVGALPQFAVLENARCLTCHVRSQGGGPRTFGGWKFMSGVSLFRPEKAGLGALYRHDGSLNALSGGRLNIGADFRLQMAKSHKSPDAKRRVFPMQAAMYAEYRIVDWLRVEGAYNAGPKKFSGQQSWSASVTVRPSYSYTRLRAGFFQPSIGILFDDHTMLVRQVPGADGSTLLAPFYAEYGAEVSTTVSGWVDVSAGVFDAASLAENSIIDETGAQVPLIQDEHTPSWLGRVEFRPAPVARMKSLSAGSSYFVNDDLYMANVFAGAGMTGRIGILAGYMRTRKTGVRTTDTVAAEVIWRLMDPFMVIVRGEKGDTVSKLGTDDIKTYTNQLVIGAQMFVLPYVELRPEYRIVDTERYRSARYAVQLHLFR